MPLQLTILTLCMLTHLFVSAQQDNASKKLSPRKLNNQIMKEQIIKLKSGVLLVRLFTKENSINALIQGGQKDLAEEIRTKQAMFNKEAIRAFRNNFTFCPVGFFYSNFSGSIISGHTEGVIFLNDSLQPDSAIKLNGRKYLTAEFGRVEQDTAKYFSHYYDEPVEGGIERRSAYYGGSDLRFEALRIMSDQMVQLKDPFPYYVMTNDAVTLETKLAVAVAKMNKKLFRFYESTGR